MTFPSSLRATDSQSFAATSAATFLAIRWSCIFEMTGSMSALVSDFDPTREDNEDQIPPPPDPELPLFFSEAWRLVKLRLTDQLRTKTSYHSMHFR